MRIDRLEIYLFLVASDFSYNQYEKGQDKHFYMCQDRINAMEIAKMTTDAHYEAVLACEDKYIRLIKVLFILFRVNQVFY